MIEKGMIVKYIGVLAANRGREDGEVVGLLRKIPMAVVRWPGNTYTTPIPFGSLAVTDNKDNVDSIWD